MPQNTNANGTAQTVVSVPPAAGSPHAFLFNNGPNQVWLGGAGVSTATGFPLPANNRVDLSSAPGTIWAIAGGQPVSPFGTANAASIAAGTTIPGSYGTANPFSGGMTIIVESGTPRQEVVTVSNSNAGSVNVTAAMTFAHGSGAVFSQYTPALTTLQVTRGAT